MVAPSSDGLFRGMKQIGDILIGLSDRPTRRVSFLCYASVHISECVEVVGSTTEEQWCRGFNQEWTI